MPFQFLLILAVQSPPLSQEEDRVLVAVEETQFNLQELNNQLVGKMNLVNDAKAQLEKNNKSLQEKSRCAPEHNRFLRLCLK